MILCDGLVRLSFEANGARGWPLWWHLFGPNGALWGCQLDLGAASRCLVATLWCLSPCRGLEVSTFASPAPWRGHDGKGCHGDCPSFFPHECALGHKVNGCRHSFKDVSGAGGRVQSESMAGHLELRILWIGREESFVLWCEEERLGVV